MLHALISNCSLAQKLFIRLTCTAKEMSSLGQRAKRISADPQPQSRASASSSAAEKTALLTVETRQHRWKQLCIKMLIVLEVYEHRMKTIWKLGAEVYDNLLPQVHTWMFRERRYETPKDKITRIISQEVVGKMLAPGEGTVNLDPALCQHPISAMRRRGNKYLKAWVCLECQTRWQRYHVDEANPGPPRHNHIVMFGRHVGKTYKEVYNNNPEYCQWVTNTANTEPNPSPGFQKFARWIEETEKKEAEDAENAMSESEEDTQWEMPPRRR